MCAQLYVDITIVLYDIDQDIHKKAAETTVAKHHQSTKGSSGLK